MIRSVVFTEKVTIGKIALINTKGCSCVEGDPLYIFEY